MQRIVDNVIAVAKESVKTFTYESLNNIVRLINGLSALLLAILPGKASILEGIQGWELRPTFRGPRLPRWMENGASSFNQFIYQLSVDSDAPSSVDYSSGGEDRDIIYPRSPLSQSSRISRENSFPKMVDRRRHWVGGMLSWLLLPLRVLLGIPKILFNLASRRASKTPIKARNYRPLTVHSPRRLQSLKDHVVQRATDRRRGVVEDLHLGIEIFIESVFDNVHKAAHCLLAPADTISRSLRWFFSRGSGHEDTPGGGLGISVSAAVLADNDPTPTENRTTFPNSHNTDARTCRDVITELG